MHVPRPPLYASLALLLLVAAASACGGSDSPSPTPSRTAPAVAGTTIPVLLDEWSVTPRDGSAAAGPITFATTNGGAQAHELTIIRTDLAPGALPLADHLVDETGLDIVGTTPVFVSGRERMLTLDLPPGAYVLICNLPEHYERGMRAAFRAG